MPADLTKIREALGELLSHAPALSDFREKVVAYCKRLAEADMPDSISEGMEAGEKTRTHHGGGGSFSSTNRAFS